MQNFSPQRWDIVSMRVKTIDYPQAFFSVRFPLLSDVCPECGEMNYCVIWSNVEHTLAIVEVLKIIADMMTITDSSKSWSIHHIMSSNQIQEPECGEWRE